MGVILQNYLLFFGVFLFVFIFAFLLGFLCAKVFSKSNSSQKLSFLLTELKDEIKNLTKQNETNLSEVKFAIGETSKLTKALTTNQNIKGHFGEDCLETVLRYCFPNKNLNYIKQFETLNEESKKIKPDYVINLPNDKNIIIDCKLNLEKFIDFQEAQDEFKLEKKSELVKDLNTTINNLSNKKYETALSLTQCDFILMYIPLESLITHIYTDNDFLSVVRNANDKNIIIVGNSSILTIIRLCEMLWASYSQEKNIDKIIDVAHSIYDLIAQHSKNLWEMKSSVDKFYESFNKELNKIRTDNKLFCAAEDLRQYGIKAQNKKVGKKINEIEIEKAFLE